MRRSSNKYNSQFLEGELHKFLELKPSKDKLESCCDGVVDACNALQNMQQKLSKR